MSKSIQGIEDLQPNPENSNLGSEYGSYLLEKSVQQFGPGRAGLCDKNGIMVAGNHTLQAIADAGIPVKVVPATGSEWVVVQRTDWDATDQTADNPAREYSYVDNRVSEANYRLDTGRLLKDIIERGDERLQEYWSQDQLQEFFAQRDQDAGGEGKGKGEGSGSGREKPEPKCRVGDLFQLGRHRLLVGDCMDVASMEKLMRGDRADLVVTDPPYNTGISQGRSSLQWQIIDNDDLPEESFEDFARGIQGALDLHRKPDAHIYLCCHWKSYPVFVKTSGLPKALIVWVKVNFGLGSGYRPQHEFIMFWGSFDSTTESNVWQVDAELNHYEHPTQKPVSLFKRMILNSSRDGAVVLDLFGGSGSALMACEETSRSCRIVEIDPIWATVILDRYEAKTGLKPKRV